MLFYNLQQPWGCDFGKKKKSSAQNAGSLQGRHGLGSKRFSCLRSKISNYWPTLFNKTERTGTVTLKEIWNTEKLGLFIALHFNNRKRWNKTCGFTKSLRKNQEKHWKPLMLLGFHEGTQTGRSQTWRRKRKSPEVHTEKNHRIQRARIQSEMWD